MHSKREGLYREWTGNVQGDAEYVTYDACIMQRYLGTDEVMPVGVLAEFGQLAPTHAHTHM